MRHLSVECRCKAWFLDFRRQVQGKWKSKENGFYTLNAAFISWMPLWSVICRFQNANTKAKWKGKGKCIWNWFLCPKCGIYLLNAAVKRDFSMSECKYKGKCKCKGKSIGKWFLCPKCGIYFLNAALRSVIFRFQNANTKAKCKCKGKCIGKWFLCPKCGIYLLNASSKRDFSISECKYKGKMQMQRQMHRKMVFMP